MNIKEAKDEIKKIVSVYLEKDKFGDYVIPYSKQRPVFLIGAPGIGKTAIMEQIAAELDLPLIAYSMTHHTRQSAIGLPFIAEREYNGTICQVSEYTMSEIVVSVYEMIKQSKKKEGILFLDEINCVSETLAPAMLLFLQYKMFGNRQIPPGWVIVTAGNPPQYNKSVRDFDIATKDRLRYMEINEDFEVWKEYAYEVGIHSAIISFLEINKTWFYRIQETVDGCKYVTARGWEDLSKNILAYEKKQYPIKREFVKEFLTDEEIARKFCVYYDLYKKYRANFQVDDILEGKATDAIKLQANMAKFDERISLLGLLLEKINAFSKEAVNEEKMLLTVVKVLRNMKKSATSVSMVAMLEAEIKKWQEEISTKKAANNISDNDISLKRNAIAILEELAKEAAKELDVNKQFTVVKKYFTKRVKTHEKNTATDGKALENAFAFIEAVWGVEHEMVLFMTELTRSLYCLEFIKTWGSVSYFKFNKQLLIYDEQEQLHKEVLELL